MQNGGRQYLLKISLKIKVIKKQCILKADSTKEQISVKGVLGLQFTNISTKCYVKLL